MDSEKKVTKIVVNKEDELTDLVTAILESRNERIVLTFAEETDLLISPINLKVLLETADETEKLLVAQIIKNVTGIRNAKLANLSTIDSPQFPEEEVWETEEINRAKRLSPPKKQLPEKREQEQENREEEKPTEFQKRIDAAIAKSQEKQRSLEDENDSVLITLDEDLPSLKKEELEITYLENEQRQAEIERKQRAKQDLSQVDFSSKTKDPIKTTPKDRTAKASAFGDKTKLVGSGVTSFFKKLPLSAKFKKQLPLIGISVVVVLLLAGIIYLNTALLVKVRIYVEAKEVEIEEVFKGDENIKEIDFENLKIPVKTESVEKSRSTNVKATGTAFKGEKAKGQVNITYFVQDCDENVQPLELPAGQTLSTRGKTYSLDSAASIKCNDPTPASISAIEVGDEYNFPAGQLFTFQEYSTNQLSALNNSGAITGGSKEEYTVLSKADVDGAVKELSNIAIEEGESEIKDINDNWELIPDSLSSKVLPDSTKTDVAIGAEAKEVNVSITTKSVGSYYLKNDFDRGVADMLTEKAKEENLFETDSDWDLELDEEIKKEVTVVESNAQGISIKLVAKSAVKPKVNTDDILKNLKTMKWKEGQEYLKGLEFSDQETRVEFFPEWFPEGLKRFPKRQGGVLISIKNTN